MCAHYWPNRAGEEVKYGKVIIKLLSEEMDEGIVKRKLELSPSVKVVSTPMHENHTCMHVYPHLGTRLGVF